MTAADAASLYDLGHDAFTDGRVAEAAALWEAATRALVPADDALAIDLYENLGIALWQLGRWRPAARALRRALDGRPTSREQALRLLVSCCFRGGRALDGERLLALYQRAFGPHPEGWTRGG